MKQYVPTPEDVKERDRRYEKSKALIKEWGYTSALLKLARNDLFLYFVAYACFKPRVFQMKIFDKIEKLVEEQEKGVSGKLGLLVVTPRQVGKTTIMAGVAEWYARFHRNPTQVGKTMIGLFSNNDDNSKKVIEFNIKDNIYKADRKISARTGGKINKYLLSMTYQQGKQAKKGEIKYRSFLGTEYNGDTIISLPPTNKGKGWTFSMLIVDEIAHIEDEQFINDTAFPTVNDTDGLILCFTTPNGSSGLFYDMFDPHDNNETHSFDRFWVGFEAYESEKQKKKMELKRQMYKDSGRLSSFQQEFEASFEASVSKFFDPIAIDNHTLPRIAPKPYAVDNTIMGIDFGVTNSKSVISIIEPTGEFNAMGRKKYELVYQYEYGENDTSILQDVEQLTRTYNVERIYIDQCPQSHYFEVKSIQMGLPIYPVKFSTNSKQKMFGNLYRAFSNEEDGDCLMIYKDKELLKQLKAMLLKPTTTVDKIEKPRSGRDDRCDSLALACYSMYDDVLHDEDSFVGLI